MADEKKAPPKGMKPGYVLIKTTTREVQMPLLPHERSERALRVTNLMNEVLRKREEIASVTASLKSEVKELEKEISKLADAARTGFEFGYNAVNEFYDEKGKRIVTCLRIDGREIESRELEEGEQIPLPVSTSDVDKPSTTEAKTTAKPESKKKEKK